LLDIVNLFLQNYTEYNSSLLQYYRFVYVLQQLFKELWFLACLYTIFVKKIFAYVLSPKKVLQAKFVVGFIYRLYIKYILVA